MRQILGLLLCLTITFTTLSPAIAKESAAKEFTLNEAISEALSKSEVLKKAELEVDRTKELYDDDNDDLDFMPSFSGGGYDPSVEIAWNKILISDLTWRSSKKTLTQKQDKTALETCKAYWDVQVANEKVDVAEKALEKANTDLGIARVRLSVGMMTEEEFLAAKTQLEAANATLLQAQNDVETAYSTFNELVGLFPQHRPVLVDRVEYYPVKVTSLDSEVNRVLESSPSVWLAEQNVSIKEYTEDLTMATGGYRPYEVRKIEVDQAKMDALDAKDSVRLLTRSLYYNVISLEEAIVASEQAIGLAEENLRVKKLEFDVGMATQKEVLDTEYNLKEAEQKLYELITQHAYMKLAFEKPWAYV